jgi:hypothetical protein
LRTSIVTVKSTPTRRSEPDRSFGRIFVPRRFQTSGGFSRGDGPPARSRVRPPLTHWPAHAGHRCHEAVPAGCRRSHGSQRGRISG